MKKHYAVYWRSWAGESASEATLGAFSSLQEASAACAEVEAEHAVNQQYQPLAETDFWPVCIVTDEFGNSSMTDP